MDMSDPGRLWQYLRLMRVDRPIGTMLLLWPTLWAVWVAADGHPQPHILVIFIAGVFLMLGVQSSFFDRVEVGFNISIPKLFGYAFVPSLHDDPNEKKGTDFVMDIFKFRPADKLLSRTITPMLYFYMRVKIVKNISISTRFMWTEVMNNYNPYTGPGAVLKVMDLLPVISYEIAY